MHVLITGSSGQIGTNLALRLISEGHEVFGIDKRINTWTSRFPYLLQDLASIHPPYEKGIGGVEYPKVDVVVHFAGHAKVHELVQQPHRAMENILMTYNVLEYCRLARIPIIFSSSREVYGDVHRYIEDAEGNVLSLAESSAGFSYTESPYSASKISGEALIYSYARCYGLKYLVFRFSNVYGRYDNDLERMERVVPLFIARIASDEPVTVFGHEKLLDFTYIDDCIEGVLSGVYALHEGRVQNQTINLAYGKGNSLVTMATYVAKALGKEPKITLAPPLVGEVTFYIADVTKARKLLNYVPKVPLEMGIPLTVKWNLDWQASKEK